MCSGVPTLDSVIHLTGNDDMLKGLLLRQVILRADSLRKNGQSDMAFQLFELVYNFIKENPSSLLYVSECTLDAAQKKQAIESILQILKSLDLVLKYDKTSNQNNDKRGDSNIYFPVVDFIQKLFAKSSQSKPSPDPLVQLRQKRTQLYQSAIDHMISCDTTHIFSTPVDARQVPDYYTIIKNPMDLSRMRAKADKYASVKELRQDIDLIVSNAQLYNGVQSPIGVAALNLKTAWLESCVKCELQEKVLSKAAQAAQAASSTATSSMSAVLYSLLVLAVAVSTPSFYSQLLRAVYQRIGFLMANETMPSEDNVVDAVIYSYLHLLFLAQHITALLDRIAGKSQFFPDSLFAKRPSADVPTQYCNMLLYLVQQAVYSATGEEDQDTNRELLSSVQDELNRHLYFSAIEVQAFQSLDAQQNSVDTKLFGSMLKLLLKLPETVLAREWSWIDAIGVTMCVSRVG